MKNYLFAISITYCLHVHAQDNYANKNELNTIIGTIDKRDTKCITEIEAAKIDFKSQEVLYEIVPEGYINPNYGRHHIILGELLKQKGIRFLTSLEPEFNSVWETNNETTYRLQTNCYCKSYNALLNLKYGRSFIKDIEYKADSLYVISKINTVFEYPLQVDDYCLIYTPSTEWIDQKKDIQNDFFSKFSFPKNFIYGNEKRDFMAKTKFTISKNDTISDLKINLEFKDSKNQRFYDDIYKQISTFISNADWQAATASDIKVNSSFEINFYN